VEPDLKIVIKDNVRRLLGLRDGQSGVSMLIKMGINNGNSTRILEGETSFGLDLLEKLAEKLGVQPWQLCVSGVGPGKLPAIQVDGALTPAASRIVRCLAEMDKDGVDVMLKMADALVRPRPAPEPDEKPTPAPGRSRRKRAVPGGQAPSAARDA
jgi:hypothetical protein